jgi:hypothetical protein
MSELVKIFKFYDETYNYTEIKKQSYYELTIKVSEKYSMENKIVYNISFSIGNETFMQVCENLKLQKN